MDKILVRATVNALGLKRGDEAYVDLGPTADAMVANGHWVWLDAPVAEPVFEVTAKVKERKPRAKKVVEPEYPVNEAALDDLYASGQALLDPVHIDYMNWADDGGDLQPDES